VTFDAVAGLRLGADDYLTKDVSLPHLHGAHRGALSPCRAGWRQLRRAGAPRARPAHAGSEALQRAPGATSRCELTLTEFWMVHALAKFSGARQEPRATACADANLVVDDGTITSHIKRIRRNFSPWIRRSTRSTPFYGMGYRWQA
jgi:two-component system OmpR family response regulator